MSETVVDESVALKDLPPVGQALREGLFGGLTTKKDGTHCAVVLLPARQSEDLNWRAAMKWAAGIDAELPTRPVAALLYATLKAEFAEEWHWTSEQDGSTAWFQAFSDGYQSWYHQNDKLRARAVRLIPLSS